MKKTIFIGRIDRLGAVTGAVLGDGYIRNGQLVIQHSIKQKAYALYKADILSACMKVKHTTKDKISNGYPAIRVYFRTNDMARRVENKIYVNRVKTVTLGILNQVTPLGLALWYLDDGSLVLHRNSSNGSVKSREVYWGTESFSEKENELICWWLSNRYNIKARVGHYKNYCRVCLNASNANKLFEYLMPFVPKSMHYKLDMHYVNKEDTLHRCAEHQFLVKI